MDISFVQYNDVLPLNDVEEVPGLEPRTLRIHGLDFDSAIDVLINDESTPSFVIADRKTIIAQVPDGQKYSTVRDISVLSSNFTATVRSKLEFKFGKDPKKITGLRAMMQMFLKVLFTTPGFDAFAKQLGGGTLTLIGGSIDVHNNPSLVAGLAIAISRTVDQIRALQARQPKIPDDERLLSAEPHGIHYDPATTALVARVELVSQSGVRAIANLEL